MGKTAFAIAEAQKLRCPIINADSRQIYREIPIGTAAPTANEQAQVKHYFVGTRSLTEPYNAAMFEQDALTLLEQLFKRHDIVIMAGGAMMYIDAVCNGLDNIPSVTPDTRAKMQKLYLSNGLTWLQTQVEQVDPEYFAQVDRQNPQRLLHALEIYYQTGQPYSRFRLRKTEPRPFNIETIGLERPRQQLYQRINARVDQMMADGLLDEAKAVYHLRHLNSLNTVGYKELFSFFDGNITLEQAVTLIKQNSRHYAKRQLTWWRQNKQINWITLN